MVPRCVNQREVEFLERLLAHPDFEIVFDCYEDILLEMGLSVGLRDEFEAVERKRRVEALLGEI